MAVHKAQKKVRKTPAKRKASKKKTRKEISDAQWWKDASPDQVMKRVNREAKEYKKATDKRMAKEKRDFEAAHKAWSKSVDQTNGIPEYELDKTSYSGPLRRKARKKVNKKKKKK